MNYLLDTSIVLDYGDRLSDLIDTGDKIFLTDIVLQELDGHKNDQENEKGYNAREFFRKMQNNKNEKPSYDIAQDGDYITSYDINGVEVHVIARKNYKATDINDSKIIEIAKDYYFTLLTRDNAQSVRARAIGAKAEVITGAFRTKRVEETDDEIKRMYDKVMDCYYLDKEIKENFKAFCDACDRSEGFEENKKRFIVNIYTFYVLHRDVTLQDGAVVTQEDRNRTITRHLYKYDSHLQDGDWTTDPVYSNFGSNVFHED